MENTGIYPALGASGIGIAWDSYGIALEIGQERGPLESEQDRTGLGRFRYSPYCPSCNWLLTDHMDAQIKTTFPSKKLSVV